MGDSSMDAVIGSSHFTSPLQHRHAGQLPGISLWATAVYVLANGALYQRAIAWRIPFAEDDIQHETNIGFLINKGGYLHVLPFVIDPACSAFLALKIEFHAGFLLQGIGTSVAHQPFIRKIQRKLIPDDVLVRQKRYRLLSHRSNVPLIKRHSTALSTSGCTALA